jgi:hypothetical protein
MSSSALKIVVAPTTVPIMLKSFSAGAKETREMPSARLKSFVTNGLSPLVANR